MLKHLKILLLGIPVVMTLVVVSYFGAKYEGVSIVVYGLILSYIFGLLVNYLLETRNW